MFNKNITGPSREILKMIIIIPFLTFFNQKWKIFGQLIFFYNCEWRSFQKFGRVSSEMNKMLKIGLKCYP